MRPRLTSAGPNRPTPRPPFEEPPVPVLFALLFLILAAAYCGG
ncbi:MAG: hypothetical protein U0804_19570 [Gemmataceae bacterium]